MYQSLLLVILLQISEDIAGLGVDANVPELIKNARTLVVMYGSLVLPQWIDCVLITIGNVDKK